MIIGNHFQWGNIDQSVISGCSVAAP